jgi:membrane protein implicated in regulation of membrane protease activity
VSLPPSNWLPKAEAFPRKNILTPIGALAVAIFASCAAGAGFTWPSSLSWIFVAIGIAPIAVAIWAYVYFALKDPDRLQTEDYRIQKEYVARIVNYVDGKQITIEADQGKLTSSPLVPDDGQ